MALLDDIRNHLAVMNPGQRERRGAVLLREAVAEIERLRITTGSNSDSPQPVAWVAFAADGSESAVAVMHRDEADEIAARHGWQVAPLYRSPLLTDEERQAIHWMVGDVADVTAVPEETLRGLLDRTEDVGK